MQSHTVKFSSFNTATINLEEQTRSVDYDQAEQQFIQLLALENLDEKLTSNPAIVSEFETAVTVAIAAAYSQDAQEDLEADTANRFLHRVLYRINRLTLFWYDDLRNYSNERSLYLQKVRNQIEAAWQQWEYAQLNIETLKNLDITQALRDRTAADIDPPISENGLFFRDEVTAAGYQRLLAIASLDGLVEASQLSRTVGGVANSVQSVLTKLLVEEYGGGRLARKHSSYFEAMLNEFGMSTQPETYFDLVPWEVLAVGNYSVLVAEQKRYFLRYIGGLLYFELTVPASFRYYQAAGERLGLPEAAMSYWNLHIKVDELHGQWMLDDVALPLVEQYPDDAWEMVLGYDLQRSLSSRASKAVVQSVREAEQASTEVNHDQKIPALQ